MGRLALVLAVLAAVVPVGAAARPHADRAPAAAAARQMSAVPALEAEVLKAVNRVRTSRGLVPLRASGALAGAALDHSRSMAAHGFFGHSGADGSAFWVRIKARYRPSPGGRWSVGENLAWASPEPTAREVVDLWMHSAPHRQNLLAPGWREIGLGAVRALAAPGVYDGLDVTIVTADFGVR
jgi:uncharacterized protein YkwD